MAYPTSKLKPIMLREILVAEVGIDGKTLDSQPQTVLADLGLDSMAQVELGVVLRTQHGVNELPDDANTMSFDQLIELLCGNHA
jgi:acyl carrier protein